MDNRNIVSNPVFLAIQSPLQEGAETSSRILYANEFSGLDPIKPTDEDLLELLSTNSFNLTDPNFRIQLEHLLEGYDPENGPWYIEGVNGVIHIHNRKIAPTSWVYRYQDENGEVLKVQIVTNWTSAQVSGTLASNIGPDKTQEVINYTDLVPDFTAQTKEINPTANGAPSLTYWLEKDAIAGGDNDSFFIQEVTDKGVSDIKVHGVNNIEFHGLSTLDPEVSYSKGILGAGGAWDASRGLRTNQNALVTPTYNQQPTIPKNELLQFNDEYLRKQEDQRITEVIAENPSITEDSNSALSKLVGDTNNTIDEVLKRSLQGFINSQGYLEVAHEAESTVEAIKNGTPLTPTQTEIANKDLVLNDPELKKLIGSVYGVREVETKADIIASSVSSTFGAPGASVTGIYSHVSTNIRNEDIMNVSDTNGLTTLSMIRSIGDRLSPKGYDIKDIKGIQEAVVAAVTEAESQGNNVKVIGINVSVDSEGKLHIKTKIAGDLYPVVTFQQFVGFLKLRDTPGVGGSKKARVLQMIRNRAKKAKQKEIQVYMTVIGRPSLEAGKYLEVYNIGNKYSGQWYIKTCIHQIDSNGYTCSLTLKRNQMTSTGSSIHVSQKLGSKATGSVQSRNNLQVVNIQGKIMYMTPYDKAYADDLALKGESSKLYQHVRRVLYAQSQGTYNESVGIMKPDLPSTVDIGKELPDDIGFSYSEYGQQIKDSEKAYFDSQLESMKAKRETLKTKKELHDLLTRKVR